MASVPGMTNAAQIAPDGTDVTAANTITQANQINNNLTQQMGQLNTSYQKETVPQLNASEAGAGEWYSGARKVAQGNAQRHFLDDSYDMISSANNALSTLYQNQAQAAIGLVVA